MHDQVGTLCAAVAGRADLGVEVDVLGHAGRFDDPAPPGGEACAHVRYAGVTSAQAGAFKTPTLRGVGRTAPYMHNGVLPTLRAVIDHYDQPPPAGHLSEPEVIPIGLTEREKQALECFLRAL